jgi:hypothetical protein
MLKLVPRLKLTGSMVTQSINGNFLSKATLLLQLIFSCKGKNWLNLFLKKCVSSFAFWQNINEKSLYGRYKSRVVLSIQSWRLLNAQNELRCDFLIHLPFPGTETHAKYPTQANANSSKC